MIVFKRFIDRVKINLYNYDLFLGPCVVGYCAGDVGEIVLLFLIAKDR